MSNLFELSAEFKAIMARAEEQSVNADVAEEHAIYDELSEAGMLLDDKIENIIKYIKNLTSQAEQLKNQEAVFSSRRKAKERKVEQLKNYLLLNDVDKFECTSGVVSSRKSQSVSIDIDAVIPSKYIVVKQTETPNKTMLKKALKEGAHFVGVELVEKKNIGVK